MRSYLSISKEIIRGEFIYAFNKYDGSQIRAEWTRKNGFNKFGTKNRLLGEDEPILGEAISLVKNKYSDILAEVFKKNKYRKVICFFEFFGPNSFAGIHENEKHDVMLFDIAPDNHGILEPKVFLKILKYVEIAQVLHRGKLSSEFIDSIRNGTLPGMTFEGVVCKGRCTSPGIPLMFKIKNQDWLDKLKKRCGDNIRLFEELS